MPRLPRVVNVAVIRAAGAAFGLLVRPPRVVGAAVVGGADDSVEVGRG